jgi:gliding motility-associated-like protein
MFKKIRHISAWLMLLFSFKQAAAQVAMPDTVCIGSSRIYKVNDATTPSTYTWKIDGAVQTSTRNELNVTWNIPGTYQLTVQEHANNGCDGDIRSGTVYVNPLPIANAGPDAIVCFGNTLRLNGSGGTLYQWSPPIYLSNPAIANPIVQIPVPGVYKYVLNVSSNGCKSLKGDTISVTMLPSVKVFAGNDTSISINQQLQLNAVDVSNTGFINYNWSPSFAISNSGIKNPVFSFNTVTNNNGLTYTVTATSPEGCKATDNITIKVFEKPDLFVPSAFTPNNDGLNDFAVVVPVGIKELKYFKIFNRWGIEMFSTTDYRKGWNGLSKGKEQPSSVFVFQAMGVDYNGNTIFKKGTVTLIR